MKKNSDNKATETSTTQKCASPSPRNIKVETLRKRHSVFMQIRSFFTEREFIEVHTPLLVRNPGLEPHLIPFETHFVAGFGGGQNAELYLPTSPEYHLKKALALGLDKIFEITRSFRNSERSPEHEPEFFMLEWYRHPGELEEIASDFAQLLTILGEAWAPKELWDRRQDLTVSAAFEKYCGIDLRAALSPAGPSLEVQSRARGIESVLQDDDFETAFHKIIVERIEPKLGFEGPLFLWEYPASMCALSKVKKSDPLFCERFEVYWKGIELANAFGELTDAAEQRRRCVEDQQKRVELYGKSPPLDEEFFSALAQLKNPAAGIAVGVERLIQCLLGLERLQDVIAFPHWTSL